MTRTGFKPIHSSNLVGRMVNGIPKGTKSYIVAKTRELSENLDMIKNTVKNCISLDEGIISNITEYQIENSIILNDKQIQEICKCRDVKTVEDLDQCDKLFLQLNHNNQMIV